MQDANAQYPDSPNPFPRDAAESHVTLSSNGQGSNQPQHPQNRNILPDSLKSTLSRVSEDTPFNLPRAKLSDLNEKHKLCAELELMGYSVEQIAFQLSVPEFWIHRLHNSSAYQTYKSELRKNTAYDPSFDAKEQLEKDTAEIYDTIKGIMRNSNDEKLKLKAAQDLADRNEHLRKVSKSETETSHSFTFNTPIMQELVMCVTHLGQLSPQELNNMSPDQMLEKLQEAIDVEPKQVPERRLPGGA